MKQAAISLALAGALASMAGTAAAEAGKTDFTFGGYIKADVMFSDYSNGAPDSGDLSRQFYVPGTIYGEIFGNGKPGPVWNTLYKLFQEHKQSLR